MLRRTNLRVCRGTQRVIAVAPPVPDDPWAPPPACAVREAAEVPVTAPTAADLCAAALPLEPGVDLAGSTRDRPSAFYASCARGAASPEALYALDVASPARVRVSLATPGHDGALHVRTACDDRATELTCNDDRGDNRHASVAFLASAARHFVFVDGANVDDAGDFTLRADLVPLADLASAPAACAAPEVLPAGDALPFDTLRARDDHAGSCGGAGAPEQLFRFELTERRRVQLALVDGEQTGVLWLRRACADAATEVACSAGVRGGDAPRLDLALDPGTYFVGADGLDERDFGAARIVLVIEAAAIAAGRAAEALTDEEIARLLRSHYAFAGAYAGQSALVELLALRRVPLDRDRLEVHASYRYQCLLGTCPGLRNGTDARRFVLRRAPAGWSVESMGEAGSGVADLAPDAGAGP